MFNRNRLANNIQKGPNKASVEATANIELLSDNEVYNLSLYKIPVWASAKLGLLLIRSVILVHRAL